MDRTEAEQTTLKELLERYAQEVSQSKRGADAEAYRIEQFKRSKLAQYAPAAITSRLIAGWRDERLQEVSPRTVLRELQLLGHVFTVAMREWGIALNSNPVALVRKPAPNKARDRDAQREALIAACGQCRNPWIKAVVIFALETATRRGEILSLTWSNVSLEARTALVSGKTGARKVPLSPACIEALRGLPRSLDGRVFPVTIETLKQAYERAVKRAGIDDFTFHGLRHDALTRLAGMGFICEALDIKNSRDALAGLDEDEKGVAFTDNAMKTSQRNSANAKKGHENREKSQEISENPQRVNSEPSDF